MNDTLYFLEDYICICHSMEFVYYDPDLNQNICLCKILNKKF